MRNSLHAIGMHTGLIGQTQRNLRCANQVWEPPSWYAAAGELDSLVAECLEMDGQKLHRIARLAALAALLSGLCFAQQDGRPRCTAKLRGRFWPEAANSDGKLLSTLARSGQLEMCVVRVWKHRWEPLTVNVTQLGKEREQKAAKDRAAAPHSD